MESQFLEACYDLAELRVGKLAGNGGSHKRKHTVIASHPALLQHVDHIQDIGFVHDRAEGALIDAGTAGDAFVIVDRCGIVFVDGDCLHLACDLAGAAAVDDRAVGADLCALAALHAF